MSTLTAWERIQIVKDKNRPTIKDYMPMIFDHFIEMHGDRCYGDDAAIMGGIARFNHTPVTIIAQVKGRDLNENKKTNFAMPHPEGYRKSLRLMKQAEKFHRPIICFVDTPGAYCGMEAEARGQHEAIARNQLEMMGLKTPIISVVLGEGGSGGALALAVCDQLAMLENATYSVISPRGFASILWKDPTKEKDAANLIRITADDLMDLGICNAKIPEPKGGAGANPELAAKSISSYLTKTLSGFINMPTETLLEKRYNKFRKIGTFCE